MVWTKLSDNWASHPKMKRLNNRDARIFWVDSICYCNAFGTDGEFPVEAVEEIGRELSKKSSKLCVQKLLNVGLLEENRDGKSYTIPSFLEFNPSRAELEAKRESTRKRVESFRVRGTGNAVTEAPCNAVTSALVTPLVTQPCNTAPVPSRPVPSYSEEIETACALSKPEAASPKPEKPKAKSTVKHSLPSGWAPKPSHFDKAKAIGTDCKAEAEAFKEHHVAKGNKWADWDMAFFTWLRNSEKFGKQIEPEPESKPPPRIVHDCGPTNLTVEQYANRDAEYAKILEGMHAT